MCQTSSTVAVVTDTRLLVHLVSASDWNAVAGSLYRPPSLVSEGFIHLSRPDQVEATVGRYYQDTPNLLVVTIDPTALDAPLVFEDTSGHGEFPHLYGPLNLGAVVDVKPYGG